MAKQSKKENMILSMSQAFDDVIGRDFVEESKATEFIDTGCLLLNALISGSMFKGLADTRNICIAGESSTGKTFIALTLVKSYLNTYDEGFIVYFDTEHATDHEILENRGIDVQRCKVIEPKYLEEFRQHVLKFCNIHDTMLEKYGVKPRIMFVLDSLAALPTMETVEKSNTATNSKDGALPVSMGRPQQITKAILREITVECKKRHIPIYFAGHVYKDFQSASNPKYAPWVINGGNGVKYYSDFILRVSKSKFKDGDEIVGSAIAFHTIKSRKTKENKKIEAVIHGDKGLLRYYGILDLLLHFELVSKEGRSIVFSDGKKVTIKEVEGNPEIYFTHELLVELDKLLAPVFLYGETGGNKEKEAIFESADNNLKE